MSRHVARERALQTLFQMDVNHMGVDEAAKAAQGMLEDSVFDLAFYRELLQGVQEHQTAIDQILAQYSEDWQVERMPGVDRNILRIAVQEMVYMEDIPHAVVMDEAVLLCKEFGTERSSVFVNGVLAAVLTDLQSLRLNARKEES
ncbi:MAG: transcription antitermination factor NusB [Firmicutes bacterium]|nr:transcription antitermination factor NusB [Bacillota bacterium]